MYSVSETSGMSRSGKGLRMTIGFLADAILGERYPRRVSEMVE
jgi:hypothetical protein